ncbi:MAG TPA: ABC transporter ATP-binding protein [Euzebyales bacterium]|nr:ABC transporter ATP-binding protein [Euzebyales bacterium]
MSPPVIEVRDLRYTYPGADRPAVRDMGFTVERGEIFGFLGPSGAGKTTTQQILIGLLRGWQGTVLLFGQAPAVWGPELYDRIGVSFELPAGYAKLTVREDLAHFALLHATAPRDTAEVLDAVGLGAAADHAVGALSKGMRGRLNLARALVHRPDLLFLDEPTSGLDPVTARRVREVIAAERDRGVTIFLTTHDMATADALCDRVAFVVDGAIAACDRPRDLKLSTGARRIRVEYRADGRLRSEQFDIGEAGPRLAQLLGSPDLETVHTTEASLDDVFVDVTGRRL